VSTSRASDAAAASADETAVFARVDDLREELVTTLGAAIAIESVNPSYPGIDYAATVGGEGEVSRLLAGLYRRAGCEIDVFGVSPGRENAVGVLRGAGGGRSLIYNGHVDVVPGGDPADWTSGSAFSGRVDGDRVWGRGACDMKGGLVAQAFAALALRECGIELAGDLVLEAVVGEECMEHELGTTAVIERGYTADAAVVSEPSGPPLPLAVVPVTPGVWFFSVTVRGKSAHAAMRGETIHPGGGGVTVGVNAIDKGMVVLQGLRQLEEDWGMTKRHPLFSPGFFSIMPGVVVGGPGAALFPATLADHMTIEYIVWYPPDADPGQIQAEIEAQVEHAALCDAWLRAHPPEVRWKLNWPASSVDPGHPLCAALCGAHERAGEGTRFAGPPPMHGARYVEDTSFLCLRGIPAISYGPGDISVGHAPDEYVLIDELVTATKTYALLAMNWCGVAGAVTAARVPYGREP
jgi:acetylornithine deacetylase